MNRLKHLVVWYQVENISLFLSLPFPKPQQRSIKRGAELPTEEMFCSSHSEKFRKLGFVGGTPCFGWTPWILLPAGGHSGGV